MMMIDLNNVPADLLKRIPFTILNSAVNNFLDLDSLPNKIKFFLIQYASDDEVSHINTEKVIDISPVFNIYDDFEKFITKKDAIISYIENLFNIPTGSYPFDPTFGVGLKRLIQTKDSIIQQTLVQNEIRNIVNALMTAFNIQIGIKSIINKKTTNSVVYNNIYDIEITLIINDEPVVIGISV